MESYLRPLRRVVSCITRTSSTSGAVFYPSHKPHSVIIGDGVAVPLAGKGHLTLRFAHRYKIIEVPEQPGIWKVSITDYFYALDDPDDREIIAYHWHPEGRGPVRFPHLHIGAGAGCEREELTAAHCPTGRVSVEEFLRLAILDFKVEPLRQNWPEVFAEAQRNFERWRTWP